MSEISLIRVIDIEYLHNYTIRLEFSDGLQKCIDFFPLLKGKLFDPLKDKLNFIQFGLNHWTIEWANGADLAPEFLYELPEV